MKRVVIETGPVIGEFEEARGKIIKILGAGDLRIEPDIRGSNFWMNFVIICTEEQETFIRMKFPAAGKSWQG